jgi:hypothetical protein
MGIKQFNAQYSLVEDRIAFNFNTEEGQLYGFVLTRVITKSFFVQCEIFLEKAIDIEYGERSSKIVSEFQREGLKKQLDFKDVFEGGQTFPLGKNPILVSSVKVELKDSIAQIVLTLVSNQVVAFGLPILQIQALALLLEKLISQANWQIFEEPQRASDGGVSLVKNGLTHLH